MKLFLRILLYLSFVFLFVYLYTKELLVIPDIQQPLFLIISLVLVLLGFMLDSKAWQTIVRIEIPEISYKHAFVSNGKFIFSKYIPGKVWIILGKAAYLKEKYNKSVINLTSYSFFYQLISLFAASLTGVAIVYYVDLNLFWVLVIMLAVFLIFFTILHKPILRLASGMISYVFKKQIIIPEVANKLSLEVFLISLFNWVVWAVAFYLFLLSMLPADSITITMGFLFPVSSVMGIIVLFAPGGIGIREGFLIIGLTFLGVSLKEATAVAFISRLWFLTGEFMFFISTIVLSYKPSAENNLVVTKRNSIN